MDTFSPFALVPAALLLAASLAACRQEPAPKPLPEPITLAPSQALAGSHISAIPFKNRCLADTVCN